MFWSFGLVNNRLAEIFFNRKGGKVRISSHCYVKREEYKTKREQRQIDQDTQKIKVRYRNKKYTRVIPGRVDKEPNGLMEEISEYTKKLFALAQEIAEAAAEQQKDYFIGGGLAIDLSVGRITRNHHDIDFHPMLEDAGWWLAWFKQRGYRVGKGDDPNFPETFKVKDRRGKEILDVWPFKLVNGKLLINYKGEYVDAGRHWQEVRLVVYDGTTFKVENPQRVLDQKLRHVRQGQKLRPSDLHDFELLGRKLNGI